MANFYNAVIPRPATIPATIELRIVAGRIDGADLTPDELAALRAEYPAVATVEARAEQPSKPAKSKASTKPRKATAKRAAAKSPSR